MTKSKTFLIILASFIIGIAISSFFIASFFYVLIILFSAIFSLILFIKNRKIALACIVIIFCCLGMLRYQSSLTKSGPVRISYYAEQNALFRGVVSKEIDERLDHAKLTIKTQEIKLNDSWQDVEGLVLIKTNLYPEYSYGDKLEINCSLKKPEPIEGFAYDRYLAKSGIYSLCYQPRIELLEHDKRNFVVAGILQVKSRIKSIVSSNLSEPQASLVSAIVLGSRRGVPQELTDKFSITGVSHMVAISGMHITIIAAILMSMAIGFGLKRGQDFWLVVVALFFYIFLIGFPPSAMRAGIMAFVLLLSAKVGRLNRSVNGLVFAAAIMLIINPRLLRDDIGFQLSFLAVLSLLYVLPWLQDKFENWPSFGKVKEMFLVTISAQAFTMPLIVYYFGRMSIISPLVNILVLPILPFVMILSFVAIIAGFVFNALSEILFWPVWLLLSYLIKVVEFFSGFSWSALGIQSMPVWLVMGFYLMIFILILKPWKIFKVKS